LREEKGLVVGKARRGFLKRKLAYLLKSKTSSFLECTRACLICSIGVGRLRPLMLRTTLLKLLGPLTSSLGEEMNGE
jgi:hypothetical protein